MGDFIKNIRRKKKSTTDKKNSSKKPNKKVTRPPQRRDMSTKEMKRVLMHKFGLQCWGCDFVAPRDQYLQMDHIDPKSMGGSDGLDNRALLCAPCNGLKSNTKTIIGLRLENLRKGHSKKEIHPIDIAKARSWCRRYLRGEK